MSDLAEFRADTKAWLHENLPESLIAGGEEYSGGSRETVQNPTPFVGLNRVTNKDGPYQLGPKNLEAPNLNPSRRRCCNKRWP